MTHGCVAETSSGKISGCNTDRLVTGRLHFVGLRGILYVEGGNREQGTTRGCVPGVDRSVPRLSARNKHRDAAKHYETYIIRFHNGRMLGRTGMSGGERTGATEDTRLTRPGELPFHVLQTPHRFAPPPHRFATHHNTLRNTPLHCGLRPTPRARRCTAAAAPPRPPRQLPPASRPRRRRRWAAAPPPRVLQTPQRHSRAAAPPQVPAGVWPNQHSDNTSAPGMCGKVAG